MKQSLLKKKRLINLLQKTKNKKDEIVNDKTKNSGPAAKKIISEKGIDASNIKSSGKGNRITKADIVNHLESKESTSVLSENTTSRDDNQRKGYLCLD